MSKQMRALFFVCVFFVSITKPAIILWDIGNTLLLVKPNASTTVKHFGVWEMLRGIAEFKVMHPLSFNFKAYLQNQLIANLRQVPAPVTTSEQEITSLIPGGTPMPPIMVDFMCGTVSCKEALARITAWAQEHPFFSANQRHLFLKMADFCFDPVLYTANLCEAPCVDVLKQCAQQKDAHGKPKHINIIISNWGREWVEPFKAKFCKTIMPYVNACVFSGEVGHAKPSKEIYQHCLELVHNQFPEHFNDPWFFVDDQPENLEAAKQFIGHDICGALPEQALSLLTFCQVI